MKILFFTDHFKPEPSAPAAHVHERSKLWVQWGHEVTVICSAPNFPMGKVYDGYQNRWRFVEYMDGIRVVRVKTFISKNEGFLRRILDYVSYMVSSCLFAFFERKPDVVISTSPHLFVPMAGLAFCGVRRLPHVFEIRDLWPASIPSATGMKRGTVYRLLEMLELLLYRRSDRILSLTNSFVEDLTRRRVPRRKIDVVINGVNLELFTPRSVDAEIQRRYGLTGYFVVGYLGTIGMAHGLENVLAAALLLHAHPIKFFFVGVGAALEELQGRVKEHKLNNVVFAGRQLKEDMPRYWSVVDGALVHLKNDAVFSTVIPSKIFESMGMGVPILYVGPKGEGSAIVERHKAGIVVAPENPQALADAVLRLLGTPGVLAEYRGNSLTSARLYSRETQARGTLEVLTRALERCN